MNKKDEGTRVPCKNGPECDGEVSSTARSRDGTRIEECRNCRSRTLTWLKRRPWEVLRYVTELKKRSQRMRDVMADRDIEYTPTIKR